MSDELNAYISSIPDSCQGQIKLADTRGDQHVLNCVYKEDAAPHFFLVFPPRVLPENIDHGAHHPVVLSVEDTTYCLNASVIEQRGDRTLHLKAKATVDPASLREYFRISTNVAISVSYNSVSEKSPSSWEIAGTTIDLSGSGVLAQFPEEPRNRKDIHIELQLPDKSVQANGHIVKKKRVRNRKWIVAFHFDNITSKNRDIILQHLFREQRRQLRENVSVFD